MKTKQKKETRKQTKKPAALSGYQILDSVDLNFKSVDNKSNMRYRKLQIWHLVRYFLLWPWMTTGRVVCSKTNSSSFQHGIFLYKLSRNAVKEYSLRKKLKRMDIEWWIIILEEVTSSISLEKTTQWSSVSLFPSTVWDMTSLLFCDFSELYPGYDAKAVLKKRDIFL